MKSLSGEPYGEKSRKPRVQGPKKASPQRSRKTDGQSGKIRKPTRDNKRS